MVMVEPVNVRCYSSKQAAFSHLIIRWHCSTECYFCPFSLHRILSIFSILDTRILSSRLFEKDNASARLTFHSLRIMDTKDPAWIMMMRRTRSRVAAKGSARVLALARNTYRHLL